MNMNFQKKHNVIPLHNKIFMVFLVIAPILSIYSTPIEGVSVADFLLILSLIVLFPRLIRIKRIKFESNYLVFFILYAIISIMIMIIFNNNIMIDRVILRFLKSFLYIVIIVYFMQDFVENRYLIKLLYKTSIFLSIFLIVQVLVYYFTNIQISGKIPFMSYISSLEEYSGTGYITIVNGIKLFRATSLFAEPSHFSQYMLMTLSISLFKNKKVEWKVAILTSIAILMTTSGQGIALVTFVWILWATKELRIKKMDSIKVLRIIITLIIFPIVLYIIFNLPFIQTSINRIFLSNYNAVNIRVEAGYDLFFTNNLVQKLFGIGFGNIASNTYMNSAAYTLLTTGIFGSILIALYYIKGFITSSPESRVMLIVMLILTFTSFYLFSISAMLAMILINSSNIHKSKNSLIVRKKIIKEDNL